MSKDVKFDFKGRTVVVTGCAGGIGRSIATEFGYAGANVVAADINEAGIAETVELIKEKNPNAVCHFVDVTKEDSIQAVMDFAIKTFGGIDILVNNAGIGGALKGLPMTNFTGEDWDRVYTTNLRSVFFSCKAVYDHMVGKHNGKIINIASTAGKPPAGAVDDPLWMEYASVKAGVIQLTRYLAIEMGQYNINVNAICPGVVHTNIWDKAAPKIMNKLPELFKDISSADEFIENIAEDIPMRRLQEPEDMAYMAMFLASDAGANITGQAINVCGGSFLA